MNQGLEAIAEFSQGRVIPRRVRYYDVDRADYVEKDITGIFYEVSEQSGSRYGIQFGDQTTAILLHRRTNGQWVLTDHL